MFITPAATLTISGSPSSAGDGLASNRNEWLASHAEAQKTGKPKRPGEVKFCEGSLSLDGFAPCILDGLFLGYDREDRQAVEPADIKASVWARSGFKEWLEIYIGLAKHARCRFVSRERPIAHFTERFARVGAPFIGVGSGFSFFAEVANQLNLEATNATRSPLRRTDRYPNQSWRNFRVSLELSRSTWLITSLFLIFPRVSSPTNASAPTGDAKMSGCGARTAGGLSRVS
jgi:hypothetical protein